MTEGYASVRDGFIDTGFMDKVLVIPGERVRILEPFEDFNGLFMYHCQNLEHGDMGMRREFFVEGSNELSTGPAKNAVGNVHGLVYK